ncbi:transmembrane amino acid transporter protein [Cooperia oncophora]
MVKIVKSAQYLCKRNKCGPLDYGQMAEEAFASSYKPLVRFRYVARWFVNCCLIFLQVGICSVYYIFVVDHAKEVLPLENKMKHPKDMDGFNGVLSTGVSLVTLIYAACGFYGYITYGDQVQGSVTLNLSDTPLNFAVKCMLLCVVYSSFLIQQYPIVEMLWPMAKRPLRARNTRRAYIIALEYLFRFSIVFVALGLAWLIPNLDQIIPLVGVTAGMLLALVLPAILEIVVFIEEWRANFTTLKLSIHIGLDCFYALLGLFFVITGLQANIKNLMSGESS